MTDDINTITEAAGNTPAPEATDRKSILEQKFDAAERGEDPAPARQRDESGRFRAAKTPVEAEEASESNTDTAEPALWKRPPASWKKEYHEAWGKADPRMQEYVWQREEQMRSGVEKVMSKAQFADAMQQAIEPYMPTIQGMGLTPERAVSALMEADHKLRTSDPQTRTALFYQLAQSYGINLGAAAQPGVQPGAVPQQSGVDPLVWQLQNELNNVRGEVMGWKQQQEMQQNQQLLNEINQFSLKAEHFEEVRPTMIQLLQGGMAETLDDAYDKAIRLNPEVAEQIAQAQQAEAAAKQAKELNKAAKAARAAAVSVRSATPGVNTAPKAATRRAILEEAFAETETRL
jgi:hypothetical protein